jgi:transposase
LACILVPSSATVPSLSTPISRARSLESQRRFAPRSGSFLLANFRPTDRTTRFLLPPSIDEWLPQRHLARFVAEVIDGLDLAAMSKGYRGSGSASYHPAPLLGLLIYGYATGVFSSRKLERATHDSVAFRFIAANDHPDHDTIATFRRRFLPEIEALFVKVLNVEPPGPPGFKSDRLPGTFLAASLPRPVSHPLPDRTGEPSPAASRQCRSFQVVMPELYSGHSKAAIRRRSNRILTGSSLLDLSRDGPHASKDGIIGSTRAPASAVGAHGVTGDVIAPGQWARAYAYRVNSSGSR